MKAAQTELDAKELISSKSVPGKTVVNFLG
jgi:hypothetical protein